MPPGSFGTRSRKPACPMPPFAAFPNDPGAGERATTRVRGVRNLAQGVRSLSRSGRPRATPLLRRPCRKMRPHPKNRSPTKIRAPRIA